ncbi:MAG: nitroreductase [Chloroflexi bacterium]|nr:nitroreductase [Chloroflexota bacterium]
MQAAADGTKIASTDHTVHPIIAQRWSPRAFSAREVATTTLRSVLEAARWSPSAANRQPWHFIVATKDDTAAHERITGVLMDLNTRWARHAPVLMLVVVKQYTDQDGNPTNKELYDAGLAVGSLTFEAVSNGLAVHQMGGFYANKAREAFNIPEGFEPVAAIALGYEGNPHDLPEDLRERELAPRTRKPIHEFVFGDEWGKSSPIVTSLT